MELELTPGDGFIKRSRKLLNERERKVLHFIVHEGLNDREIAERMGLKDTQVLHARNRVVEKMECGSLLKTIVGFWRDMCHYSPTTS